MVQPVVGVLRVEGEEEQVVNEELLGEDGGEVPGGEVLQRDEAVQVVSPLRVVPRAGAVLPQQQACDTHGFVNTLICTPPPSSYPSIYPSPLSLPSLSASL